MDAPSESNTLTATALFAASVVADAFTAHGRDGPAGHAPTSLRTSAIVLVACLAGPPIREWLVREQRAAIAALLVSVALAGAHASSADQRLGDAVYIALLYAALLYSFWAGGAEKGASGQSTSARSKDAPPFLRREALMNLAIATLCYSSLRVLRAGFDHPIAASNYAHTTQAYDGTERELQGYAYSSSTGATALAFGATVGVGTTVALFSSLELRTQGTAAATLLLTVSATAQLAAAFVVTLSQSEALANLPAVWSTGACSSRALCPSAYDSRRLSVVNQSPSALWLNGIGTFVLAYAPSLRFRSRAEMLGVQRNFEMLVYGLVGASIAVASLLGYLAFTGAEALSDYACVGATISVFVTAYVDSLAGALSFAICLVADVATNWAADGAGAVFAHLERCYELQIVVLLLLYVLIGVFVEVFWYCVPRALIDACDAALGLLTVAGTSAATALYLWSAAEAASYDGQLLDDTRLRGADNRFARTAAASITAHWLPLLVWLPLYSCRCEAGLLTARARATAWYVSGCVPVIVWFVALLALEASPTRAVGWLDSGSYLFGVLVVAAVPWAVLVWA